MVTPQLKLVGFTIGNDVSARDIEGENPLYLPQAKLYDASCAPRAVHHAGRVDAARSARSESAWRSSGRAGPSSRGVRPAVADGPDFRGADRLAGRDNSFPDGVILLTGTGIVPPDEFTLEAGDRVKIAIDGIGTLINPVDPG